MKSKVYFTRIITPEKVLEMYEVLGKELIGKIAVKLHSGEEGNQNFSLFLRILLLFKISI